MYDDPEHARQCIAEFRERYNNGRPHWALIPEEGGAPLVPEEVYSGGRPVKLPRWPAWARDVKARLDKELALVA